MKKVLLGLLVALALGGGLFAYSRHARKTDTRAVLNPTLAASYNKTGDLLKPNAAPSDQALRSLKELTQRDAKNALSHYLLAAAYSKRSQWTDTAIELKAGNDADYCVFYRKEDSIFSKFPNFTALREIARNCAISAPTLSGNQNETLLLAARQMGTRVARMEPKMLLSVLVGVAIHSIIDSGLVRLYTKTGKTKDAEAAQARLDIERAWTKSPQFQTDSGVNEANAEQKALLVKYDLGEREVMAAADGKSLPAEKMKRMREFNKEVSEQEQARTEKLLQSLPE